MQKSIPKISLFSGSMLVLDKQAQCFNVFYISGFLKHITLQFTFSSGSITARLANEKDAWEKNKMSFLPWHLCRFFSSVYWERKEIL